EHFRAVADAGALPVVAYNVPGRTGVNMMPETVLALAEDARFVAVKEASGSLDQACEILRARPPRFAVLSGEDSLALPMVACGAEGVIAVVSNEAPALLVELVSAALAGDRTRAAALQARLFPLMRANFRESNPIPVKWALQRLGLCGGALRLPLVPLSPAHHAAVEDALRVAGLLESAA
ncbi:MAG TPA: dihydrodipicolinate synthase family protein, partial [Thermoanaerobaculia bacterium]|nr:dihydrodipicolinate synthase family protein [Thermoanaerobaculia bacterium]